MNGFALKWACPECETRGRGEGKKSLNLFRNETALDLCVGYIEIDVRQWSMNLGITEIQDFEHKIKKEIPSIYSANPENRK